MMAGTQRVNVPRRVALPFLGLMAFLAVLAPQVMRSFHYSGQPTFWDAHVYARALHAFQCGGNPYAQESPLTFVYPPVFLICADFISRLVHGQIAWQLYLLINLLALVSVPFILSEGYLRSRWFTTGAVVALFVCHPLFTSAYAFVTGNIANVLYAMVLLGALPGLRRGQWFYLHGAVAIAACIKLPMLSFLLLPLLAGEGQILASAMTVVCVAAVYAVQWMVNPAACQAYVAALRYQVLDQSSVGLGVFAAVLHMGQHWPLLGGVLPLLAHCIVFGALLAGMVWNRAQGVAQVRPAWFLSLTVLLALLWNPRMVGYDLDMLVIPMAFLVGDVVRTVFCRSIYLCMLPGLLAVWFLLGHYSLAACYLASLACFPLCAWATHRAYRTRPALAGCPVLPL